MFGLLDSDIEVIKKILESFPEIEEAVIFGSRAKGTNRPGSDVDIALKGYGGDDIALRVSTHLNQETNLPFFFDIVDFLSITNEALLDHINRIGRPIYKK